MMLEVSTPCHPDLSSSMLIKFLINLVPDDHVDTKDSHGNPIATPFVPKKHVREELDALKIPQDRRDVACRDYYAEFKKCIMV